MYRTVFATGFSTCCYRLPDFFPSKPFVSSVRTLDRKLPFLDIGLSTSTGFELILATAKSIRVFRIIDSEYRITRFGRCRAIYSTWLCYVWIISSCFQHLPTVDWGGVWYAIYWWFSETIKVQYNLQLGQRLDFINTTTRLWLLG